MLLHCWMLSSWEELDHTKLFFFFHDNGAMKRGIRCSFNFEGKKIWLQNSNMRALRSLVCHELNDNHLGSIIVINSIGWSFSASCYQANHLLGLVSQFLLRGVTCFPPHLFLAAHLKCITQQRGDNKHMRKVLRRWYLYSILWLIEEKFSIKKDI